MSPVCFTGSDAKLVVFGPDSSSFLLDDKPQQKQTTEQLFPNMNKVIIVQGEIIGSGQCPLQLAEVQRFALGHLGRGRGVEASSWSSDTEHGGSGF